MKSRKTLVFLTISLVLFIVTIGLYGIAVSGVTLHKQSVPMFVLQASDSEVSNSFFTQALATSSIKNDKNLYLFRQDKQEFSVINTERKTKQIKLTPFNSVKALAVNSKGRIFIASDSELNITDIQGNWLKKFPIPKTTVSLAALNDGNVAISATDSNTLLTVFDESGNVIRSIGGLKQLDKLNNNQNRFLNTGKVAASQSGDIYHISMFSPIPTVQKFSKQGKLIKEFAVEGAAIELQSKRGKEFLQEKKIDCTGGYYVIKAATVDPNTGNLWIGMNGGSKGSSILPESGVLYEYDPSGEKLAEYALSVASINGKTKIITSIQEIAVNFPFVYIQTVNGQVFSFNLEQRLLETSKQQEVRQDNSFVSFITAKWKSTFSTINSISEEEACPNAIETYSCNRNCPAGSTPTSVNCGAELRARLNTGEVIISASCSYGAGGENGGCSGSITGCATNGVRIDYSVTLTCNATPTPTPQPTPEPTLTPGGGGDPECEAQFGSGWYFWNYSRRCVPPECHDCEGLGGTDCPPCWTPLLIDINGNGFQMTDAPNGVMFAPSSNRNKIQTGWTATGSDDAWLVLDRNGNGMIDDATELFSCAAPQPPVPIGEIKNGFLALAEYDKPENGGNNDGKINGLDSIFGSLRLWQDTNHNGISESNELKTLSALNVATMELDYKTSKRADEFGNRFRYRAKVKDAQGAQVGRWAWDVFPVSQQP